MISHETGYGSRRAMVMRMYRCQKSQNQRGMRQTMVHYPKLYVCNLKSGSRGKENAMLAGLTANFRTIIATDKISGKGVFYL